MKRLLIAFVVGGALVLGSCSGNRQEGQEAKMKADNNKRIAITLVRAFDTGDAGALDSLVAEDVVDHQMDTAMTKQTGRAGVKEVFQMYHQAFSDMHTTVQAIAAAGDTVMVMEMTKAKHTGPFMGIPASNEEISFGGVDIFRLENGMVVEHWGYVDPNDMMKWMSMQTMPQEKPKKK